jgi:hypothetical protein
LKRKAEESEESEGFGVRPAKKVAVFRFVSTFWSAKPDRRGLRIFESPSQMFVLKPDLLGVLGLKKPLFPYLSSANVDVPSFKSWAKKHGHTVGTTITYLYAVDQKLKDYLMKFEECSGIASDLELLLNSAN